MNEEPQCACADCGHTQDSMELPCEECGGPRIVAVEVLVDLLGEDWKSKIKDEAPTPEDLQRLAEPEPYPVLHQLDLLLNSHARLRWFQETQSPEIIIENEFKLREQLLDAFLAIFPRDPTTPSTRISERDIALALRVEMTAKPTREIH